jgi:hypothetical protein
MKTKLVLMAVAICLTVTSFAQMGRPSFGVRAGVNFQNLNGKDGNDDRLENNLLVGFNAGVNAEVPIAQDFFIQPGLLYSVKGAKSDDAFAGQDIKVKLNYLELPINLLYKPALGEGRLLMGFGPYIAYALNGKVKGDNDAVDIEFDNEASPLDYADGPVMKRFDAGANLLFGFEMSNNLSAQINAQLGLLNLNPKLTGVNEDLGTLKNTGFGVSLGYRF